MNRRNFVKTGMASALVGGTTNNIFGNTKPEKPLKNNFNLKYAPHFGMFENNAGKDLLSQLHFMSDNGFTALEDNGMMGRSIEEQEKISKEMQKLNMTMGVFVLDGGDNWKVSLTTGKQEFKDLFLKTCKTAAEVAKRVNAKWMTVVPGYFERNLSMGYQTSNIIEAMRRASDIFEPLGLIMVLEPLSDNPDLFLRFSDQSFAVCQAVKSPSCKFLFDLYHMQRNEGNLIKNLEKSWNEVAYIQIGDNPGRNEPGTGEINYKNIFKFIYEKGYKGVMGMEHGISKPGKEGEMALIKAYMDADDFLKVNNKK